MQRLLTGLTALERRSGPLQLHYTLRRAGSQALSARFLTCPFAGTGKTLAKGVELW